jgi:hypothetical protein
MSGRVRVTHPDGHVTTGYRKTQRRQTERRTPAHEAPTLRVAVLLPPVLAFSVRPGPISSEIEVTPLGSAVATVTTFDRDKPLEAMAKWLAASTHPRAVPYSIAAVISSSSEPGWQDYWYITVVGNIAVVSKTRLRPLVIA